MLKEIVVEVSSRENTGKNESRRLRAEARVPGIVYGGDRGPVPVAVDPRRILEILRSDSGANTLFTLHLEKTDTRRVVMIRDYQRDPVKGSLLHVDFVRIDMTKPIEVKVPIHIMGTAVGVKTEGGIIDHIIREVAVSCLPAEIPSSLSIDVSEVHVGQHLSIRDMKVTGNVRILADADQTVLVISLPKAEVVAVTGEEAVVAEAAPTEPEVIKKGKEAAEEDTGEKKGGEGKKTAEAKKPAEAKKGGDQKKG